MITAFRDRARELFKRPAIKIIFNILLIFLIGGTLFIAFHSPKKSQSVQILDQQKLIALTNKERLKYNLAPLFHNGILTKAALNKANNLLKEQYFAHNSPAGKKFSSWVKEVQYNYYIVGENLAEGFSSDEMIIQAWMESPAHRQNILQPEFKEIGMAVLKGNFKGKKTKMVVQIFGATPGLKLSEIFLPYQAALKNLEAKLNGYS